MITKDAKSNMITLTDIYKDLCSFEELYQSYLMAIKHKRTRDDVMKFSYELESNLLEIQNELTSKTYNVGPYHSFYVTEPKLRLVMAQQFRDRIVNWAIYRQLYPFYDKLFIDDSYACRLGKGSLRAANRLQYWVRAADRKPRCWYYLKFDISKYFYRVNHAVLMDILSRRIRDPDMLWLLDRIINSETRKFGLPPGMSPENCTSEMWLSDVGMPIGNLTSQLFANVYLNELDQFVKHKLKAKKYVRYMDDGVILSDSKTQLAEYLGQIALFLSEKLRLELNKKTRIAPCDSGIEFVGYRIWPTHRILKRQTARRMMRYAKGLRDMQVSGAIGSTYFAGYLASISGTLKHCDSMGLRTKIFGLFNSLKTGTCNSRKKG